MSLPSPFAASRVSLPLLLLAVAACGGRSLAPAATPAAPPLPPVPRVSGPLAVRVEYPSPNALIAARDSNFLLGSVGNGAATLTINGTPVPVLPNGAFLAWLPLPPRTAPRYDIVATLGADTSRLTHAIRLPATRVALPADGPLVVDSGSMVRGTGLVLRDSETVRIGVRAAANADAWIATAANPRLALGGRPGAEARVADVPAAALRAGGTLVVARAADTARFTLPPVPAPSGRWVSLGSAAAESASDTDRTVVLRPTAEGTYKWFLFPGTPLQVTGARAGFLRVRLDQALEAWVAESDTRELPATTLAPQRTALNARVVPDSGWVDVVIPTGERPAFQVEEQGTDLVLTLYGTQAGTDIIQYSRNDPFVRTVTWTADASDRVVYRVHLARAPFGYLTMWNGSAFVLRVRRPPAVDAMHPLRGRTIAVDPGHPPIGATGPTGLYEAVATLAVGERLRTMLEAAGAKVVMTRSTAAPVALGDRPIIARRANAEVLVSVHLNALPDGINPFRAQGSGAYFFHPQSEPLARALQRGMVAHMGLPNLGVYYDNLALARPTWMPSVLCEGAFIIIPEQEAALRTPEFQARYAQGIADGLAEYFRGLAAEQDTGTR